MPPLVLDIFDLIGALIRVLGFLVVGYGLAKFTLDAYKKAVWQVQIALALGFFGILVALTDFASSGGSGAYALGAGIALVMSFSSKKDEEVEEPKD